MGTQPMALFVLKILRVLLLFLNASCFCLLLKRFLVGLFPGNRSAFLFCFLFFMFTPSTREQTSAVIETPVVLFRPSFPWSRGYDIAECLPARLRLNTDFHCAAIRFYISLINAHLCLYKPICP